MSDNSFAITKEHIAYRKRIGNVAGAPLFEIMTTGGLFMNVLTRNGTTEIVGTGSHRAISRYITEKKVRGVEWEELSKSDHIPVELISPQLLQKYEDFTDHLRELHLELKEAE